jgi:hypothetical protein
MCERRAHNKDVGMRGGWGWSFGGGGHNSGRSKTTNRELESLPMSEGHKDETCTTTHVQVVCH